MEENKPKPVRLDEMPEWCGADVIAALIGKSVRRVQQLTQDGTIHTEIVPGTAMRKYRLIPTIKAYVAYVEAQRNGQAESAEKRRELELRKLEADTALRESQGELHRLKTDLASGKYLLVEEAQLDLSSFLTQFKKFALAIPSRVGGMVAGYIEPVTARALEKDLNKEITNMLRSFVEAARVEDLPAKPKSGSGRKPTAAKGGVRQ